MDANAVIAAIAAVISVVSFLLTYLLGRRQVDAAQRQVEAAGRQVEAAQQQAVAAQHDVDSSTLIDLMKTFGEPRFQRRYQYVVNELHRDHPPDDGTPLFDLPGEAGDAAVEVAYFMQNCAAFADYGIVSEDKLVTFLHRRFAHVWEAIAPYVRAERDRKGFTMLSSLEVYAGYVETLDEHDVHAGLVRSAPHFPSSGSRAGGGPDQ